jgi:hypothetical protein
VAARNLLLDAFVGPFEGHLERETRNIARASGTAESREGVAVVLARRKHDFQGVSE